MNSEAARTEQTVTAEVSVEEPDGDGKVSLGVGLVGALLGSVCCLLPALALAVGFGGAAGLVQLGKYQPYLLGASILFVGGLNWYLVRRRQRCCTTGGQRKALYIQPMLSVVIFLVAYLAINNALVPWLYDIRSGGLPSMW